MADEETSTRGALPMSNLGQRIVVGALGAGLIVGLALFSRVGTQLLFSLFGLVALVECLLMRKTARTIEWLAPFILAGLVALVLNAMPPVTGYVALILALAILAGFGWRRLVIWLYPSLVTAGIAGINSLLQGGGTILLILLFVTWATDIGAYAVGMKFGRRLLAPDISPKKTWEGALGGLAASLAVGVVAGLVTREMYLALAMATLAGTAGQIGDLLESIYKREAGVKDSGGILPGHGGILDRFDAFFYNALLFSAILLLAA